MASDARRIFVHQTKDSNNNLPKRKKDACGRATCCHTRKKKHSGKFLGVAVAAEWHPTLCSMMTASLLRQRFKYHNSERSQGLFVAYCTQVLYRTAAGINFRQHPIHFALPKKKAARRQRLTRARNAHPQAPPAPKSSRCKAQTCRDLPAPRDVARPPSTSVHCCLFCPDSLRGLRCRHIPHHAMHPHIYFRPAQHFFLRT